MLTIKQLEDELALWAKFWRKFKYGKGHASESISFGVVYGVNSSLDDISVPLNVQLTGDAIDELSHREGAKQLIQAVLLKHTTNKSFKRFLKEYGFDSESTWAYCYERAVRELYLLRI